MANQSEEVPLTEPKDEAPKADEVQLTEPKDEAPKADEVPLTEPKEDRKSEEADVPETKDETEKSEAIPVTESKDETETQKSEAVALAESKDETQKSDAIAPAETKPETEIPSEEAPLTEQKQEPQTQDSDSKSDDSSADKPTKESKFTVRKLGIQFESSQETVLGLILFVFGVLKLPMITSNLSNWQTSKDQCNNFKRDLCEFNLCNDDFCDSPNTFYSAYAVMEAGLALIIVFSLLGMLKHCIAYIENICGCLSMIGLVIGGLLYMVGYWLIMDYLIDSELTDKVVWASWLTAYFFEFWLGGITAIIYGISRVYTILDNEHQKMRTFVIGIQLCMVSLVCFIVYSNICVAQNNTARKVGAETVWETALIAAGYAIVFVSTAVFAIFYLFNTCMECSDGFTKIANYCLAGLLASGGILASIGYWTEFNIYEPSDDHTHNAWVSGYCLLLIVLCCFNAWDMLGTGQTRDTKVYDAIPKQEQ